MTYLWRHRWEAEVRLKPFCYLGARRSWVASIIPRSLCPREIFSTVVYKNLDGPRRFSRRARKISTPPHHRRSIPGPSSRIFTVIRLFRCNSLMCTSELKFQLISTVIMKQINESPVIFKILINIKGVILRREGGVRIWSIHSAEGSDVI
jgi:hypothetical protein